MSTIAKEVARPFLDDSLSVVVGCGIHYDIQQFLFREALLLDHERYDEWLKLLCPDIRYHTPARFARERDMDPPAGAEYFEDDRRSLTDRVRRLQNGRRPGEGISVPVQIRRLVTNVIVCPYTRTEYNVLSYLLITRTGQENAPAGILSAERHDRIRRSSQSFKIFSRQILMDQKAATQAQIDMFL